MKSRVVVIGGNAAGMAAASRAKRLDPDLDITLIEAGPHVSYAICGVPFLIAGIVQEPEDLIQFTPESLERERGIKALVHTRAVDVLTGRRSVVCLDRDDRRLEIPYDKLVLATGYQPRTLPVKGARQNGVFTVSRLDHGVAIRDYLRQNNVKKAAVIGGGYVGLLMAPALCQAGLQVVLLEKERQILGSIDEDMAQLMVEELDRHGVRVHLGCDLREITGSGDRVSGVRLDRETVEADLVLVDVGIRPNTELADHSGISRGLSGAIRVDARGQTDTYSIYAAGNCAETLHLISNKPLFSSLATTAAKQGRVVGENLAGWRSEFAGTLETSIEKVFDLSVARSGLTLRQAMEHGFDADSVKITGRDRTPYCPGSLEAHVKLIFQRRTGSLLGGQIVGSEQAARRIDTVASALTAHMSLEGMAQLDLAYSPSSGTLWDPLQIAANAGLRQLRR